MTYLSRYPNTRLRRLRSNNFIRNLVQENHLTINDLIFPVFVQDSKEAKQEISAMPGQFRYNIDSLLKECENIVKLNIPAIAIFPVIEDSLKTIDGREATNPNGLLPTAVKKIKQNFPDLGIITDVALDPFTSHGQDGILDNNNHIINDETIKVLIEQAIVQTEAGSDIIAPSDMMDGRIGAIRNALEEYNYHHTAILSYAAKFASHYYGPYREAVRSLNKLGKADKKSYQLNFANLKEALEEVAQDIQEGADIVMVKPGMPYLDVIHAVTQTFNTPTFAYQVSGEYAMHKLAFNNSCFNQDQVILESLLCFKRAGASAVLTYFALDAARILLDINS